MQRLTILVVYSVVFFFAASAFAQTPTPANQSGQIGYHEDPKADQKRTLLLKDFKPDTMMHASVHEVPKAKFYVIDVHNHVNDAARLDEMVKAYPDRFMVFAQYDWSKIDDQNFSQEMVAQLDNAVTRGARGLKVLKDLGLGVRDKSGKLIAIDDPRLDPVWEE